jgi:hypothetical protein
MPSWNDVTAAAPDLATRVQARFDAHGLAVLATLRRDGSPRVSGIEVLFALGELWLGMMPGSRKSTDLRRDPRLALHSATVDKEVRDGDAKVAGRAHLVDVADERFPAFVAAFEAATGQAPPPGPFDLHRVDVTEIGLLGIGGDHLVVESWHEGGEPRRVERR